MRGVYAITNVLTDTVYYGQSVNMEKRLRTHAWVLRRGDHDNPHLQRSWNRDGAGAFVFTPVYLVPDGDMTVREKSCIDGAYGMGLKLFNLNVAVPSARTGAVLTPETRAKISAGHLGKKLSAEHCAKLSASRRGKKRRPLSLETRAKLSVAHLGQKASPESRAAQSAAQFGKKRGPMPAEQREKLSDIVKAWWAANKVPLG